MQGQSPYIINTGLYYDNTDKGWQASLLYNIIGKRIIFVGEPNTPHTYELPRNLMEVLFIKKIGDHLKIKFGIEDIFNNPVQFVQTMEGQVGVNPDGSKEIVKTDHVIREFSPGRKLSFGFSYTF